MIIKRSPESRPHASRIPKKLYYLLGILLLLSLFSGVIFRVIMNNASEKRGLWGLGASALQESGRLSKFTHAVSNYLRPTTPLPKIAIDVKFKHWLKIVELRNEALQRGTLVTNENSYVPAQLSSNSEKVKVDLRLKGDWLDHIKGDKWSMRIKTKKDDSFFGLRRFSLQSPRTKAFHANTLFYTAMREFDILAPRIRFVELLLNGDDWGIMMIEEHFSKELLESNNRKESVILKYDESLVWEARDGPSVGFTGIFDSYTNAKIDGFGMKKIEKSNRLRMDYRVASGLLRGFSQRSIPPSAAFDSKRMGAYLAVAELFGAWHAIRWPNMRFYYNPTTGLLEPIAFDCDLQSAHPIGNSVVSSEPITKHLLEDPAISRAFADTLTQLYNSIKEGALISKLKKVEEKWLPQLQKEFYFLTGYDFEQLHKRADALRLPDGASLKNPGYWSQKFPVILHAYLIDDSTIEIINATNDPINITQIYSHNRGALEPAHATLPLTLLGMSHGELSRKIITVKELAGLKEKKITLTAHIEGDNRIFTHSVEKAAPLARTALLPETTVAQVLSQHPYLHCDATKKVFNIGAGTWNINGSLILPRHYSLELSSAPTLLFDKDAIILIREGHFHIDAPTTTLLSAKSKSWDGIAVLNSPAPSKWHNVHVENTSGVTLGDWELSGGVVFYESDVDFTHAAFTGHSGEDALNVVRSSFDIRHTLFDNAASDAFDADFSRGELTDVEFKNIGHHRGGGDGLDISGSSVTAKRCSFTHINDKAISVGEKSTINATDCSINNATTGIACKDGSQMSLADTTIENVSSVGVMAYVKKQEYESATITAHTLTFKNCGKNIAVQKGSHIRLNDKDIPTEDVDVEELYNTIMKKGK
jgi:hypothetical protein